MTSDKREELVTTYLEMRERPRVFRNQSSAVTGQKFDVHELMERNWQFNREMYFRVGENWRWIDKRPWTDEQWKQYASDPNLRTFAGYCDTTLIGYYELKRSAAGTSAATEDEIEIAYFGLLPEFIGRGLGSALLTSAVENAWTWSPTPSRVWVHTCNRDHPSALANYQARGFAIYRVDTSDVGNATDSV